MKFNENSHNLIHGKIGRNEPCPCGSGKKFKKCCLGKSNARSVKTDFSGDAQLQSKLDLLDNRVFDIIEELNNNYYQTLAEMSREDYFQVTNNIYEDKRYEKYDFTVTEMKEIIEKYGLPPHGEDEESISKTRAFSLKAVKEKYTDNEISLVILDHYSHLVDCYDQGKHKESWVLARHAEELIKYLETRDELPLFLFKKVLEVLDIIESTTMEKEGSIIEAMGIDLNSLKEKGTNITDFIKDFSLTNEQAEKAKELFENNPDRVKEQGEVIEKSIEHLVKMIFSGELSGLLLKAEEIKPARDNFFELFFQKFPEDVITTMPQEQINKTVSQLMMDVAEKWRPHLLDSSRWTQIVEAIKSEIKAIEDENQTYKHRTLLISLLLLDNVDEHWAIDYIGSTIVFCSLKNKLKEDALG